MAGALLFEKIIEASQKNGCKVDADFPFCFLMSYPFGPMLTSVFNAQALTEELAMCLDCLARNHVTIAAIACNTLHAFLPPIPEGIRLVHMIQETESYLKQKKWNNPLVLCSSTSAKTRLHASYFSCRYPSQALQKIVDELIDKITEGCNMGEAAEALSSLCMKEGPLILGCTELSLLHARAPLKLEELCCPNTIVSEKIGRMAFVGRS